MNLDSSVSKLSNYALHGQSSIPSRERNFFHRHAPDFTQFSIQWVQKTIFLRR